MFNKFLFLSLCFFSPILANDIPIPDQANSQVGRYQMVGVPLSGGTVQLHLLDTTNGYVWYSARQNNWVVHDTWKLQIANPPNPDN
jgi:hypothetical protein